MQQFRKTYNRYRSFVPPLGIVLVSVICLLFIILPAVRRTIILFDEVSVLRKETEVLEQKVNLLSSLDERTLEDRFNISVSALPLDRSVPTILQTVEGVSDQTGVVIQELAITSNNSLSTQSAKPTDLRDKNTGVLVIPFTVDIAGNFEQLSTFLTRSNSVRRLLKAKSFSLSLSDDDQLTTQIVFDTFFSPLTPNAAAQELTDFTAEDMETLNAIEQFSYFGQPVTEEEAVPPSPEEQKSDPFSL